MDQDDLLVIRVPSTALNPTLDHRPRASGGAKICDRLSTGTAALRKERSFTDGVTIATVDRRAPKGLTPGPVKLSRPAETRP